MSMIDIGTPEMQQYREHIEPARRHVLGALDEALRRHPEVTGTLALHAYLVNVPGSPVYGARVEFHVVAYAVDESVLYGGNIQHPADDGRFPTGWTYERPEKDGRHRFRVGAPESQPDTIGFEEEAYRLIRIARDAAIGVPVPGYLTARRVSVVFGSSDDVQREVARRIHPAEWVDNITPESRWPRL